MTLQRRTPLNLFDGILRPRRGDLNYRDLAEQLMDALFVAAPRMGLFLYANHKAVELTGYSRAELEDLSLSELFPARQAEAALEIIRGLEPGAHRNLQNVPMRVRGGKLVFTDLRVSEAGGDGESLVVILARSAEQRAAREQSLIRRGESLAALGEMFTMLLAGRVEPLQQSLELCHRFLQAECVVLYQPAADSRDLLHLKHSVGVTPDFPAMLNRIDPAAAGLRLDWRSGERPTSALTRAARACALGALHAYPTLADGGGDGPGLLVVGYRAPHAAPNENSPVVGAAVNFLNALGSHRRQVEARCAAEAQLGAAQSQLDALLAETSEGVMRVDKNGRLVSINPAAEVMLGFRLTDTVGTPLEDVLVAARPLATSLLSALKQGLRWGGLETDLVRRDGQSVAVFVRAVPLVDEEDRPRGGLLLLSDRTDQRQFQAQSDHLERRAWLGDLSAIFAHDVRNPLNGISVGLDYLASKFEADSPLYEAVSKMQAEVARIDQLLKNVLLVAKSTELNYQPVALTALLERTIARWTPRLARRNIQLSYYADPATPPATADVHQIDQVFTNLIVNAADAMGANGGTLTIKCQPPSHARAPRGQFVELIFGDTGPGIAPEMIERIFEPFITTKADGTGLGLAITKRIVTGHKGTIFVESWPGIGTAFYVYIPVAK